ncbi:MAG: ArsA family ATPase [Deltaproteobacteria bacterium]
MSSAPSARWLFFAGKGGVGKTSCAAAAALAHAEQGERLLVVSTDPAHSLGDALGARLTATPRRLKTPRGWLDAAHLDADRALGRWLDARLPALRLIGERGTYLAPAEVERFVRLSLPGVDELMGLWALRDLASRSHERIVVDMAPTGHALRLLETPALLRRLAQVFDTLLQKHRFLAQSLGGRYRPDQADAVVRELEDGARELRALIADGAQSAFHWVLLPEPLALEETLDGVRRLAQGGLPLAGFIVNRCLRPPRGRCEPCAGRLRSERATLARIRRELPALPIRLIPELEREPIGQEALRALWRSARRPPAARPAPARVPKARRRPARLPAGAEAIFTAERRLVFIGGKGGVGKTSCAAALALALARASPERRILLLSVDPAHSLGDALGATLGDDERPWASSRLRVRELDAGRALDGRKERLRTMLDEGLVSETRRSGLQATYDRAVAEELLELTPPGMDELFGLFAIADALAPEGGEPTAELVIVDTAPTGHALRLLGLPALALEWVKALMAVMLGQGSHGQLARELVATARQLRALSGLLGSRERSAFVPVCRASTLPVEETLRLARSLEALGLELPAIVWNAAAVAPPSGHACARCLRRLQVERAQLESLCRRLPSRLRSRCVIIGAPAAAPPPRGEAALLGWSREWRRLEWPDGR